jgi:replicative DNA helicase
MVMPHSEDLENAVLGTALRDSEYANRLVGLVDDSAFYQSLAKKVFHAISAISAGNGIADYISVKDAMSRSRNMTPEASAYLLDITNASDAYGTGYMDRLLDYRNRRHAINMARELIQKSEDLETDMPAALDEMGASIASIRQNNGHTGPEHISAILPKVFDQLAAASKGQVTGFRTGLAELDRIIGGLQRQDLVVLAGRPSMGKTALAECIAANVAQTDGVLIFSQEMAATKLVMRDLCRNTGISMKAMESLPTGRYGDLSARAGSAASLNLWIDDTSAVSIMDIIGRSAEIKKQGLGLVIVDYLQLMKERPGRGNRQEKVAELSRGLKSVARELNACVIAVSQLSREVEQREDKHPVLSDLRESGAIETDADQVLMVYRDEYYNQDSEDKGIAEIGLLKNRNGPTGWVKVKFVGERMLFENIM